MYGSIRFTSVLVTLLLLGGSSIAVMAQDDGLVTEEVEPGVERIVSDGAGHDLDEKHPTYGYDMDQIAIAPDGAVWLATSYSREDNDANPPGGLVWALGRPGTVTDTVGGQLVVLSDGTLLVIGDEVRRVADGALVPDDGPMIRSTPDGEVWILQGDQLAALIGDDERATNLGGVTVIRPGRGWSVGTGRPAFVWAEGGPCATAGLGVTCERDEVLTTYLADTPINQIAAAPDGTVWAVGGYDGDNGGLYHITLD